MPCSFHSAVQQPLLSVWSPHEPAYSPRPTTSALHFRSSFYASESPLSSRPHHLVDDAAPKRYRLLLPAGHLKVITGRRCQTKARFVHVFQYLFFTFLCFSVFTYLLYL